MPGQSRLESTLAEFAARIEGTLSSLLPMDDGPASRVAEAMRYAVLGGGKRLRPFLVYQSSRMCGVADHDPSWARVAAAVEYVHVYSLVHDDLPAMDNDDLRRGKPTAHKAFDEATAILAGDALLTLAFGLLAQREIHADAGVRCELAACLAQAIGTQGMIGGQMMDMLLEGQPTEVADVTLLQRMKTADLITCSCEAGAILGQASASVRKALRSYGRDLGLAFQAADDLLDAEGSAELMGKAAHKDAKKGKPTLVAALGTAGTRERAQTLARQAKGYLDSFDEKADLLRELAAYVVQRRK